MSITYRYMTPPNYNIKKLAAYEASLSTHRFRVGAVIYSGKNILGRGFNNANKTHPKSPHPFYSIHAEFSSFIHAIRYRANVSGCSIYVHRLLADGSSGFAKPCFWCAGLLERINIKDIWWSMEQNKISGV